MYEKCHTIYRGENKKKQMKNVSTIAQPRNEKSKKYETVGKFLELSLT